LQETNSNLSFSGEDTVAERTNLRLVKAVYRNENVFFN